MRLISAGVVEAMAISPNVQTKIVAMYSGTVRANWVRKNPVPVQIAAMVKPKGEDQRCKNRLIGMLKKTTVTPFVAKARLKSPASKPLWRMTRGSVE